MYISRKIDSKLAEWKDEKGHKPLLIRGARQVGKTHTIREFGKSFEYFIELNFEESPKLKALFIDDLNPTGICENVSAIFKTPVIPGKTLLFIDEIQECKEALSSLRFFYEKMPELHLIAAGSLLEFALAEIPSFGVGRIRSIFMYPLSFEEYLFGSGETRLQSILEASDPTKPIHELLHQRLIELTRKFICLGGMPEIISDYIENKDLNRCQQLLDDLVISIRRDFVKYRERVPATRISEVFHSVVIQSGHKFIYYQACAQANHSQIKEALQLLTMAGLVIPVTHTSASGLPLGAGQNARNQKMLLYDTGIFQRMMGLDLADFLLSKNFEAINKGNLAEQFVGLELVKSESCYHEPALWYWHREAKSSNAEVDYIIANSGTIVPIEVKAGTKGSMQSLYMFIKEKQIPRGIRISNENFSTYDSIEVYPLYAVSKLITR